MPRASLLRAWARQRGGTNSWYGCSPRRWSRPRSRSRRGSRRSCRCGCRSRSASAHRCLNGNRHRRSCFEEVDGGVCSLRRLIGVESEIIQCAPANRVGILVLREGFTVPCQRVGSLGRRPRCAAVPLAVKRAIVCPARMLGRCMKPDVTNVSGSS